MVCSRFVRGIRVRFRIPFDPIKDVKLEPSAGLVLIIRFVDHQPVYEVPDVWACLSFISEVFEVVSTTL